MDSRIPCIHIHISHLCYSFKTRLQTSFMEAVRDRYTVWGTPVYQNTNTAEKGLATPLLADHRATYPVETPQPRRSWVRKIFLHFIHFTVIASVFYFFVPRLLPGSKFVSVINIPALSHDPHKGLAPPCD